MRNGVARSDVAPMSRMHRGRSVAGIQPHVFTRAAGKNLPSLGLCETVHVLAVRPTACEHSRAAHARSWVDQFLPFALTAILDARESHRTYCPPSLSQSRDTCCTDRAAFRMRRSTLHENADNDGRAVNWRTHGCSMRFRNILHSNDLQVIDRGRFSGMRVARARRTRCRYRSCE
jgi:hypothetical protein